MYVMYLLLALVERVDQVLLRVGDESVGSDRAAQQHDALDLEGYIGACIRKGETGETQTEEEGCDILEP